MEVIFNCEIENAVRNKGKENHNGINENWALDNIFDSDKE